MRDAQRGMFNNRRNQATGMFKIKEGAWATPRRGNQSFCAPRRTVYSLVFKKGRNVDSVLMEESLCLQLESSLEESPVFKRKNSQANSPSLDNVTSLTPDVIRVVRRL